MRKETKRYLGGGEGRGDIFYQKNHNKSDHVELGKYRTEMQPQGLEI